jgi:hypothetical protein
MNKNANDADRQRIAQVDRELSAGGLSSKEVQTLKQKRSRLEGQIGGRPEV